MITFVTRLRHHSPPPELPCHGHGWIELPDGRRWQPGTGQVTFSGGAVFVSRPVARRRWWFRLMGLRGG